MAKETEMSVVQHRANDIFCGLCLRKETPLNWIWSKALGMASPVVAPTATATIMSTRIMGASKRSNSPSDMNSPVCGEQVSILPFREKNSAPMAEERQNLRLEVFPASMFWRLWFVRLSAAPSSTSRSLVLEFVIDAVLSRMCLCDKMISMFQKKKGKDSIRSLQVVSDAALVLCDFLVPYSSIDVSSVVETPIECLRFDVDF